MSAEFAPEFAPEFSEYCRMAARYLKAETSGLFANASLLFEEATKEQECLVKEEQALYEVRPAKKNGIGLQIAETVNTAPTWPYTTTPASAAGYLRIMIRRNHV